MKLIEIPEENIKINMPSELAECNSREYMDMAELIFKYQFMSMPYDEMKIQAVYKLLNLKAVNKKALTFDPSEEQKMANIILLSELIDSFFDINPEGQLVIKQNYIHNPIPSFRPVLTNYVGPANSFMNVSWGEYADALRAFYQFHSTGDVNQLYLIAAILYRKEIKNPKETNADNRQPYLTSEVDWQIEIFKKEMPFGFIYGVFLFFASFKQYISTAVIPWGGKEIDLSIVFDTSENQEAENIPGIGLDSLTFAVAESAVFGNYINTRNTSMWEILIRMYDLRKKDLDQKKQSNDNSTATS
jgi:hypothetical protein